ncbi:MAG: tetratricopeptide repeat protein [Chitinophagaceae bacterium]|nr:tetratricopeptide repeat protein [Chitinophagaceae bacterium]
MRIALLLVTFILLAQFSSAQTRTLDSVDRLIKNAKSDTARINQQLVKMSIVGEISLDSARLLALETIKDCQRINYVEGEIEARGKLAINRGVRGDYNQALENILAIEKLLPKTKDEISRGRYLYVYGTILSMQTKYDSALILLTNALDIGERLDNAKLLKGVYQNLAITYQMQSNYPMAIEYMQKALTRAEAAKDYNSQAYLHLNLALTYRGIDDTVRAKTSFLKALEYGKTEGLKIIELYASSNLASSEIDAGHLDQGYNYAIRAAELGKEVGDPGMEATSLSRAAFVLGKKQRYAEADEMIDRALVIADSSKQPLNIYQVYSAKGTILLWQEKFRQSIVYYEKAFDVLKGSDLYTAEVGQTYYELSTGYEKSGQFQKALGAYKMAAGIVDSVRKKQNVREATEITKDFEFGKQQNLLKSRQEEKDAVAHARQVTLIIGLLLTAMLAAFAFYAYKGKSRTNKLLETQKTEIERTLEELKALQTQLVQSEKMASLGELTAGIAHEIQNPLNFVNNFSDVNLELINELQEEKNKAPNERDEQLERELLTTLAENETRINHHGKRADSIVKGMLQHSRTSTGQKEATDVNALADECLRLSYHGMRAKDKSFNAKTDLILDNNMSPINIVSQDIGRVLLNLLTNAFYSVAQKKQLAGDDFEPAVSITTKQQVDKVLVIVRDNGNGVPAKVADKIFQPFFTTKPVGQGTGLGLSLSYDIIKSHNGQLSLSTEEGKYAEFTIVLPR